MRTLPLLSVACLLLGAACGDDDDEPMMDADLETYEEVEEFEADTDIDGENTTANLDLPAGQAMAPAMHLISDDTGDASHGAFAPTLDGELAAGEYQFASVDIVGVAITVPGDLVLRVTGPISVSGGARLEVKGTLTVIGGSGVTVTCAQIVTSSQISIHVPGPAGVSVGCDQDVAAFIQGAIWIHPADLGVVGDGNGYLDVRTRGPITLDGRGRIASDDGWVTLRSYGDVTLATDSFTAAAKGWALWVETEGKLTMSAASYLLSGADADNGEGVRVRAVGDISLDRDSFIATDEGGDIDVVTEGTLQLAQESYFFANDGLTKTPAVTVASRGLTLTEHSYMRVGRPTGAQAAGRLDVDSDGPIELAYTSYMQGAPATCAPGGDVHVRATGMITARADAWASGGASEPGEACLASTGGALVLESAATVTPVDPVLPWAMGGAGSTAGDLTTTDSAAVSVLADAELRAWYVVQAVGLPVQWPGAVVEMATMVPAADELRRLHVSEGPGEAFRTAEQADGRPLVEGWRWRVELGARMFDGSHVDRVTVRYARAVEE